MFSRKSIGWVLCGLCLALTSARAAEKSGGSPVEKLNWTKGPAKAQIKHLAEVQVPEGFMFTDAKGTQTLLEAMGNPTNGDELGFLCPTNMDWFVVFEFDEVGYVKDDDKDKLNADKMLKAIKEGNEEGNKVRKRMGVPPLNIVGWEKPPAYDEKTHNLEWAIRGESEGDPVVNYNTRLLGRHGVMEVSLVVDPKEMATALPKFKELLTGYSYQTGEKYAEYKQGDKVAQYGLAALVVGGAAAVGAKLGLFAYLALMFKKAWKLIVVAVVAVGAWIRNLVLGKSREPEAE
ncbi:MAG: DUF2167 domain-containing protein [Verrucomicrobiota bacterium]